MDPGISGIFSGFSGEYFPDFSAKPHRFGNDRNITVMVSLSDEEMLFTFLLSICFPFRVPMRFFFQFARMDFIMGYVISLFPPSLVSFIAHYLLAWVVLNCSLLIYSSAFLLGKIPE